MKVSDRSADDLIFQNQKFLVASVGQLRESADGVVWKTHLNDFSFTALAVDRESYIGAFNEFQRSIDLVKWEHRSFRPSHGDHQRIASDQGILVAVGRFGTLATCRDGNYWFNRSTGTPYHLNAVAFGAGTVVAVGDYATILQSDPLTATAPTLPNIPQRVTTTRVHSQNCPPPGPDLLP